MKEDIYIGTVYFRPYKNNNDNLQKNYEIMDEIDLSQKKGEVIIQGDFNARTNVDDNLLIPDTFDKLINVDSDNNNIPPRNSKDELPSDHRGKELLELCKILNLIILNGRKTGDLFGGYTSFQWIYIISVER